MKHGNKRLPVNAVITDQDHAQSLYDENHIKVLEGRLYYDEFAIAECFGKCARTIKNRIKLSPVEIEVRYYGQQAFYREEHIADWTKHKL